jgi:hypothetical protein
MEREPRVAAHMRKVVKQRLGGNLSERGDIVTEELEEGDLENAVPRKPDRD